MVRLSPQLVVATARALAGFQVTPHGFRSAAGDPRQGFVDPTDAGQERPSWDAHFLQQCGYWAHYEHRTRSSSWPIPVGLTTPQLAEFGSSRGILHSAPESGDIFLMWGPSRKRFVRCGLVLDVLAIYPEPRRQASYDLYTVEGDTDDTGGLLGGQTRRVRRRLSPRMGDRFLRWVDLEDEVTEHIDCSLRCSA